LTTALELAQGKYAHDPSRILVIGEPYFGHWHAQTLSHLPSDRSANPPELDAASSDINKITRGGEYANKTYSDLGVRSIDRWINDPFWAPYFSKSGSACTHRRDGLQSTH
jgi:sarcosine oxidase/L-pipecolate oxidase